MGIKSGAGITAAAQGAATRIVSASASVTSESPMQYSKFTKRMPSMMQNSATAMGVLSEPNRPDSALMNRIAKATISTERTAMAVQYQAFSRRVEQAAIFRFRIAGSSCRAS